MNISYLVLTKKARFFIAVFEKRSIRKASETLNVAPSSVSRQISEFEHQLGTVLFERKGAGLQPTSSANSLYISLHKSSIDLSRSLELIFTERTHLHVVKVHGTHSAVGDLVAPVSRELAKSHPDLNISYNAVSKPLNSLSDQTGNPDIVLGFDITAHKRSQMMLASSIPFRVWALMRPAHPHAACHQISLEQCKHESVFLPDKSWALAQRIERHLGIEKTSENIIARSNSTDFMTEIILNDDIIGFHTLIGIESHVRSGRLLVKELTVSDTGPDKIVQEFYIYRRKLSTGRSIDVLTTHLIKRLKSIQRLETEVF